MKNGLMDDVVSSAKPAKCREKRKGGEMFGGKGIYPKIYN